MADINSDDLLSMPFDRYQRFKAVADLLNTFRPSGLSVIDVGGDDGAFAKFISGHSCLSVDKQSGVNGTNLPFPDKSFDAAVSIDVLEHVPQSERGVFIRELLRVARHKVIIAAPFANSAEAEKVVFALTNNPWLREHIELGLPKEEQMEALFNQLGLNYNKHYNGNLASWIGMIILHHVFTGEQHKLLNGFFNRNFYHLENRPPAYRTIYELNL